MIESNMIAHLEYSNKLKKISGFKEKLTKERLVYKKLMYSNQLQQQEVVRNNN